MLDINKKLHKIFASLDPYAVYNPEYNYDEADGENFSLNPLADFMQSPLGQAIEDIYTTINMMNPYKIRNNSYDYDEADGENFYDPLSRFEETPMGKRVQEIMNIINYSNPYFIKDSDSKNGAYNKNFLNMSLPKIYFPLDTINKEMAKFTPSFGNILSFNVPNYHFEGRGDIIPTYAPFESASPDLFEFDNNLVASYPSIFGIDKNDKAKMPIWHDPEDAKNPVTNIYQGDNIANNMQFGGFNIQKNMSIEEFGQQFADILNEANKNRRNV